MLSVLFSSLIALSSACNSGDFHIAYNAQNCRDDGGTLTMTCHDKSKQGTCGMRLDGNRRIGRGTYTVKMKAAPGPGVNTAFYLYSYGRHNDQNSAWNEIDIEILGKQISNGRTKIWTNLWTGFKVQHGLLVEVPWDASQDFHEYTLIIDDSNIYWKFDGHIYRTLGYTQFGDVVNTLNTNDFQAEMALWGWNQDHWPDMGSMSHNDHQYPLYGHFKDWSIQSGAVNVGNGGNSGNSGNFHAITMPNGKCLDIHAPDITKNGGKVQIWDCNRSPQQSWRYDSGTKRIQNQAGHCLDVDRPDFDAKARPSKVHIWECHNGPNQKWDISGGRIKSMNGLCLDVWGKQYAQNQNGAGVQLYDCGPADNQKFAV